MVLASHSRRRLPPGITVSAPPHLPTYTPSENFTDPLRFIPERCTGDERFVGDKRAAVHPFSVGSRDCLGKKQYGMAKHEMRLILVKVLWSFDIELCEQQGDWLDQKVFLTWEKMPLMVRLKTAEG
ncbi:cytochrome P450 [Macroventuria anomochaeta]|uniref:Cytochrome P450 n=1 Tax=Macroventuria anomochaeta TaxID=301207 RepID=A0ACB6SGZ4_9PLEO|nr:cytochrome P450 [Macroventuria anomochaeta]KAF2632594.1 cytochrome P450 [Macroventuria anomochaeta]